MWLPGSGNDKLGTATRAKPEIWQPKSGIGGKAKDLKVALQGLVQTAGSGLEGLRGSIGAVGKACGSCHKAFRAKKK
jgi:cytochrome c556